MVDVMCPSIINHKFVKLLAIDFFLFHGWDFFFFNGMVEMFYFLKWELNFLGAIVMKPW